MQIAQGMWQVEGLRAAHVYILAADGGAAVVDTGVAGSNTAILAELQRAGFKPSDVRVIVATHAHIDHIGSVVELQQATGAPICASPGEAAAIEGHTALPHPPGIHGALLAMVNQAQRPEPTTVTHRLMAGPRIPYVSDWHVVPTPGHTPDHISLFDPQRGILIAGDALANFGRIRRSPWLVTSDMRRARASVALLAGLPIRSIVFGHGKPVLDDPTLQAVLGALGRSEWSHT